MLRFSISYSTALLIILLFCIGCSGDGRDAAGAVEASSQQNIYAQFQQRAQAFAQTLPARTLSTPTINDVASFVHADAPLEFWLFLAVLSDQHGNDYALQQRFARLNLAPRSVTPLAEVDESQWSYSNVVAMDYQFDHLTSGQSEAYTQAQREALDLSGASVEQRRVWLGAFHAQDHASSVCDTLIEVSSPQLSLRFGNDTSASASASTSTSTSTSTVAGDPSSCEESSAASIVRAADFAVSRGPAMPVSGSYRSADQNLNLSGHGWVVQGWGVPPNASVSAVVLDRAWLLMERGDLATSTLSVQLQRSQRASGRGPRITSGTLYTLGNGLSRHVEPTEFPLELIDDASKLENEVPLSWQLNSAEQDMALTLTPVASSIEKPSLPGQSWFGLVVIDGTHQGYGFVDYSLQSNLK